MDGGAIGMVLLISRVFGVAPFLKGAEYHVSLPLVIVAKLFIIISCIVSIIITLAHFLFLHKKYGYLKAVDILRMMSFFSSSIAAFASVFNSPERIMRVLRSLKELNQMDKQILGRHRQYAKEIKLSILIFFYIHLTLVLRWFGISTLKINNTILNYLIALNEYMIILSQIQLSLFARRIMFSLKSIHSSLEELCKISTFKENLGLKYPILAWENVKEHPFSTTKLVLIKPRLKKKEPIKGIRQCLMNYFQICDIITSSMDGEGLFTVIALMNIILHLLTNSFKVIVFILNTDYPKSTIFFSVASCILYAVSLIILMEPYHRVQSEMQKLQFLLMSLKWKNVNGVDIDNELLLFRRVIKINKPKYSPLGIFTLNRLFVYKVFGSLVTYLVIVVTYGLEFESPGLITV